MLKKTITYTDYEGNKRTEDFFFNLSEAEVIEWLTTSGDYTLDKVLVKLSQERNIKKIMEIFKDFIYRSYGEKSLDGRRFVKSEEVKLGFMETEAYSQLFTELVSDSKKAAEFINKVMPPNLQDIVNKVIADNPNGIPAEMNDYVVVSGSNGMITPA